MRAPAARYAANRPMRGVTSTEPPNCCSAVEPEVRAARNAAAAGRRRSPHASAMLMTPPIASEPYDTLDGPRTTSMRLTCDGSTSEGCGPLPRALFMGTPSMSTSTRARGPARSGAAPRAVLCCCPRRAAGRALRSRPHFASFAARRRRTTAPGRRLVGARVARARHDDFAKERLGFVEWRRREPRRRCGRRRVGGAGGRSRARDRGEGAEQEERAARRRRGTANDVASEVPVGMLTARPSAARSGMDARRLTSAA